MHLPRRFLLVIALAGLLAMTAAADPLTLAGYTTNTAIAPGASFTGMNFTGNLGDSSTLTNMVLGTFSLWDPTPYVINTDPISKNFAIDVHITQPTTTTPTSQDVAATINGYLDPMTSITGTTIGIHFDPTPAVFKFDQGEFYLTLQDIGVAYLGDNIALVGDITTSAVPEPASVALLSAMLVGVGIAYRRRRRI